MDKLKNDREEGGSSNSSFHQDNTTLPNVEGSDDKPPNGISEHMWKKFQQLQKRRADISRGSTTKRMKKMKTEILQKVSNAFGDQTDLTEPSEDSSTGPLNRVQQHTESNAQDPSRLTKASPIESTSSDPRESWCDVKPYLRVNEHMKGLDKGRHAPKTKLEGNIDSAIALGDYETAESLSDRLATREFGKEIADAFDAKRYAEQKREEEKSKAAKQKKKLNWGFEHKQRWEMKGNM